MRGNLDDKLLIEGHHRPSLSVGIDLGSHFQSAVNSYERESELSELSWSCLAQRTKLTHPSPVESSPCPAAPFQGQRGATSVQHLHDVAMAGKLQMGEFGLRHPLHEDPIAAGRGPGHAHEIGYSSETAV